VGGWVPQPTLQEVAVSSGAEAQLASLSGSAHVIKGIGVCYMMRPALQTSMVCAQLLVATIPSGWASSIVCLVQKPISQLCA